MTLNLRAFLSVLFTSKRYKNYQHQTSFRLCKTYPSTPTGYPVTLIVRAFLSVLFTGKRCNNYQHQTSFRFPIHADGISCDIKSASIFKRAFYWQTLQELLTPDFLLVSTRQNKLLSPFLVMSNPSCPSQSHNPRPAPQLFRASSSKEPSPPSLYGTDLRRPPSPSVNMCAHVSESGRL